ncbi:MAG: squalene synthase HpnC [bacterium]
MELNSRSLTAEAGSLEEAENYCRQLAGEHYENFTVVLPGLSRKHRQDLSNIYAFCRWADDLADEIEEDEAAARQLSRFRQLFLETYNKEQHRGHPVFWPLVRTVKENQLSKKPFLDLISAFEQDLQVKRYENFEQLIDYCSRSANPVGRLVLGVFDCCTEQNAYYSDMTCTALQLTNFWADIPIDLAKDRIYIPRDDMERFNLRPKDLREGKATETFRRLLRFEINRTRDWFRVGWRLVERVDFPLSLAVELFNSGGWAVLDKINENNYDVFKARWTLGKIEKFVLGFRGLWRQIRGITAPPGANR